MFVDEYLSENWEKNVRSKCVWLTGDKQATHVQPEFPIYFSWIIIHTVELYLFFTNYIFWKCRSFYHISLLLMCYYCILLRYINWVFWLIIECFYKAKSMVLKHFLSTSVFVIDAIQIPCVWKYQNSSHIIAIIQWHLTVISGVMVSLR